MHIEHIRLLAKPFRALLAERNFKLSHNQALDFLASIAGLRNWPEANAMPSRLDATVPNRPAAARLARRVVDGGGPEIEVDALLRLIAGDAGLQVWPDGPRPGIYACTEEKAAAAAVRIYLEETGDELFFTDGVCQGEDAAIVLGEHGLSSAGLSKVARGTLVVTGPMEMNAENWEDNRARLIAASNCAESDMRVLLVCETLDPKNLHHDLALLLRLNEPAGFVDPNLRGVVDADGQLRALEQFVGERPRPGPQTLPPPRVEAPTAVRDAVRAALAVRSTGLFVASTAASHESCRWSTLEIVLPLLATLGRVALVVENTRGSYGREITPPDIILALPTYTSVESAVVDECKVIVVDFPSHPTKDQMMKFAGQALFVMTGHDLDVGSAFFHQFSDEDPERLEALVAVVGGAGFANELDGQQLWDVYAAVPGLKQRATGKPLDTVKILEKHRAIRWEDGYSDLAQEGLIPKGLLAKSYRRLSPPRARRSGKPRGVEPAVPQASHHPSSPTPIRTAKTSRRES